MAASTVERSERQVRTYSLQNVEVREAADGGLHITGRAAVFNKPSEDLGGFTERIQRGAFKRALQDSPDVVLLQNHDPNLVLARTRSDTLRLWEDPSGLNIDAQAADTSYARDLKVLMERGDVDQMSFAFSIAEGGETWLREDGKRQVTVTDVARLYDVSVVTQPAYTDTSAEMRSRDPEVAARREEHERLVKAAEAAVSTAHAKRYGYTDDTIPASRRAQQRAVYGR